MSDLREAAEIVRDAEVKYSATWQNAIRLQHYTCRVSPFVAANPLHYVERFLAGVKVKQELRARPIPRHRALVVVR